MVVVVTLLLPRVYMPALVGHDDCTLLTRLVLLQDWCDPSDAAAAFAKHGAALSLDPQSSAGCPNWQSPASQPVGINRKTIGWNAAAACFAYGYGILGLQGYKYVGAGETPRSLCAQLRTPL